MSARARKHDDAQGDMFALLAEPLPAQKSDGEPRLFLCGCGAAFTAAEAATLGEDEDGHLLCRPCERAAEEETARIEAAAELHGKGDVDEDENERGEVIEDENYLRRRIEAEAIAAGRVETLTVGHTQHSDIFGHEHPACGKTGYVLRIWQHEGQWWADRATGWRNGGGCGPASKLEQTTRDEVIEAELTRLLVKCAGYVAKQWPHPTEAQWLAEQAIASFPPLLCGFDLHAIWQRELAEARADEDLRKAMRRKRDYCGHRAGRALRDAGLGTTYRGPEQGMIKNGDGQHIGWWWLEGHADDMQLVIGRYDKHTEDEAWPEIAERLKALPIPATVYWRKEPLTNYRQQCAFGWVRYGKHGRHL